MYHYWKKNTKTHSKDRIPLFISFTTYLKNEKHIYTVLKYIKIHIFKSSAPGLQWFIQPAVHAICHHQWHRHRPGAHHGQACGLRLDEDQVQGSGDGGGEEDVLLRNDRNDQGRPGFLETVKKKCVFIIYPFWWWNDYFSWSCLWLMIMNLWLIYPVNLPINDHILS